VSKILKGINSPEDIKKLNIPQIEELCGEIREFLIEKVSKTGGHLASNLGVVELTLSLHTVFDSPKDKIIWDVGHQSYVHKIITGRKDQFDYLRQLNGISGFPKSKECIHDCFDTGHSSTSISAALGLARARDIKKEKFYVVAVIGDGALTGGMAFEALNDAGRSNNSLIVVLNDNEMSISKNVGGLSKYLSRIRTQPFYYKVKEDLDAILNKIPALGKTTVKVLGRAKDIIKYIVMPNILFEELGFKYLGPIDGHNVEELNNVFERAKTLKGPVLVHVCTQKGKGYPYAEKSPHKFHGISPFEVETGEIKEDNGPVFSDLFGKTMVEIAEQDSSVVAVTAAMPHGTGLAPFSKRFADRFYDVGIAEQHAVTFSAGLAKGGLKPVFAVYSSFLQRAYDQIIHDVALQNLHVVFAIDRAGIVGEDGETHQGIYDLSYLRHIPNMAVMSPCDYSEFEGMLKFALQEYERPVALRYPRGKGPEKLAETAPIKLGRGVSIREGRDLTIVALGLMVETALKVADMLAEVGIEAEVINARFVKPLDEKLIIQSAFKTGKVVTLEDNTVVGGFGSCILEALNRNNIHAKLKIIGFPDEFIPHGSRSDLMKLFKLDAESIFSEVMRIL
jgi:1-deoxy-D-xylulose-5-phosphate synthase